MTNELPSLDELFAGVPGLPPQLVDRSTAERYANCPFAGHAVETGLVVDTSAPADSGNEVHRVISEAVHLYATEHLPLREHMEAEILKVRPDVQQDAVEGLRRSIWSIDRYLTSRAPQDIVAYQGGTEGRQGQLSWDLLPPTPTSGAVRPTSEIDLLMAGASQYELHEIDFKSGHKLWSAVQVKNAFQFRFHAWLAFKNFPDLVELHVQVWNTRLNSRTPPVTFRRRDAEDFEGILLMAVEARRQALKSGKPEAWPHHDKCVICPAVRICPKATKPALGLNTDPAAYAKDTEVLAELLDVRLGDLKAYVAEHGAIDLGGGHRFGIKPPTTRKTYGFHSDKKVKAKAQEKTDGD